MFPHTPLQKKNSSFLELHIVVMLALRPDLFQLPGLFTLCNLAVGIHRSKQRLARQLQAQSAEEDVEPPSAKSTSSNDLDPSEVSSSHSAMSVSNPESPNKSLSGSPLMNCVVLYDAHVTRWVEYKGVRIHAPLYRLGIPVIESSNNDESSDAKGKALAGDLVFSVGNRTFTHSSQVDEAAKTFILSETKSNDQAVQVNKKSKNLVKKEIPARVSNLLKEMQAMKAQGVAFNTKNAFFNNQHSDEIFVSVAFPAADLGERNANKEQKFGVYMFPWLSRNPANIYLMGSLPSQRAAYKNAFVFVLGKTPKLYHIDENGETHEKPALNVGAFNHLIRELKELAKIENTLSNVLKGGNKPLQQVLTKEQLDRFWSLVPATEVGSITPGRLQLAGFEQFVTAGCMFGTSLKATMERFSYRAIIKHNTAFYPGEKIKKIQFNPKMLATYEAMLFDELEKTACIIDAWSKPGKKHLQYHLPFYDYMLFGVELFVRGRIGLETLGEFFAIILRKKDEHVRKITAVCAQHNIVVRIESPFENLFGPLPSPPDQKSDYRQFAESLLIALSLDIKEVEPKLNVNYQGLYEEMPKELSPNSYFLFKDEFQTWKIGYVDELGGCNVFELDHIGNFGRQIKAFLARELPGELSRADVENVKKIIESDQVKEIIIFYKKEKEIVGLFLDALQANAHNLTHQKVWCDFLQVTDKDKINNLEELFKIANAVMVGVATHGKPHYQVCSLLAVSEKQIQLEYQSYSYQSTRGYPAIFNATLLEPMVTYGDCDPQNKGLAFYFNDDCGPSLTDLITNQGFLKRAGANVARYMANKEPLPLDDDIPMSTARRKLEFN